MCVYNYYRGTAVWATPPNGAGGVEDALYEPPYVALTICFYILGIMQRRTRDGLVLVP